MTTQQFRKEVLKLSPGATRHQWRVLGWGGTVVYGICSAKCEWLSFGEPNIRKAWEEAYRFLTNENEPGEDNNKTTRS